MEMILTEKEYKDGFAKADIIDCVVRNKNFFHFILMDRKTGNSDAAVYETNVIKYETGVYLDSEIGKRCSQVKFKGWDYLFAGATLTEELNQVVVVDWSGKVYARGNGSAKMEEDIPKEIIKGALRRIRMIQGQLYVAGDYNTLCYRTGIDTWESTNLNVHIPAKQSFGFNSEEYQIVDMDGFSPDNLYAISRKNYIWHFNGEEWTKIRFPSNMYLDCICCAEDGNVYISGMNGAIFKGCCDKWEQIHNADLYLPFQDMVYHAGKIWCTSRYGVWTLENDVLTEVELDEKMKVCIGHLSVADGVMLMAGTYGAAYHDGNGWNLLFNSIEFGDTGGWK